MTSTWFERLARGVLDPALRTGSHVTPRMPSRFEVAPAPAPDLPHTANDAVATEPPDRVPAPVSTTGTADTADEVAPRRPVPAASTHDHTTVRAADTRPRPTRPTAPRPDPSPEPHNDPALQQHHATPTARGHQPVPKATPTPPERPEPPVDVTGVGLRAPTPTTPVRAIAVEATVVRSVRAQDASTARAPTAAAPLTVVPPPSDDARRDPGPEAPTRTEPAIRPAPSDGRAPAPELREHKTADDPDPPPTIDIRIGRLEVRAATTGVGRAHQPVRAPRREPRLSLEEYLRARRKGSGR